MSKCSELESENVLLAVFCKVPSAAKTCTKNAFTICIYGLQSHSREVTEIFGLCRDTLNDNEPAIISSVIVH